VLAARRPRAARALYAGRRDREAKRRGVDPATLDAESERLAHGGYAAPPSVVGQAIERAEALDLRGDTEGAITLLEITLDDGGGTDAERIRGLRTLARALRLTERYAEARAAFTEARALADRTGRAAALTQIDAELSDLTAAEALPVYMQQLVQGIAALRRSQYADAISPLRAAARTCPPGDIEALAIRWRLAVALDKTGDAAGALAEAARALALAERLDDDEVAGRMTLMVKRLSAERPIKGGR